MTTPDELRADCDCGERLWRQRKGEWTLANRIVKLAKGGGLVAKCPRCGEEVGVPFLQVVTPEPEPLRKRRRLVVHADRLDKSA